MVIATSGDLGDSCITLGIISQLHGGPHKFLLQTCQQTKMRTLPDVERWLAMLKPLAEAQPYIEECRIRTPQDHVDWDSGGFRGSGLHSRSASLFEAQLAHFVHVLGYGRVITPLVKWLHVEPSEETRGRVVISRSGRYRNGAFQWKPIVEHYGDLLMFVGLPHEHQEFCGMFGMVEYRGVSDCLEMSELIAGSELFIGNQSSPMTIAEGLKHPTIQETSTDPADCIYYRENAQWVDNGKCTLPDIGGRGAREIRPASHGTTKIVTHTTPPGDWQLPGLPSQSVFFGLVNLCKVNKIKPPNGFSIEDWIKHENSMRVPEFFFQDPTARNCEMARMNAGYKARSAREMMGL